MCIHTEDSARRLGQEIADNVEDLAYMNGDLAQAALNEARERSVSMPTELRSEFETFLSRVAERLKVAA